jgi:DNA-binding NarL/FixJ family response regulator
VNSFILADRQDLTRFAIESIIRRDNQNTVFTASDKARLTELLTEHEFSVVVLDYALFDFISEDQLLTTSERFSETRWLLLSDSLTPGFLSRILYASTAFSVVFKDSPLSEIRSALSQTARGARYFSQQAMEIMLSRQAEDEKTETLTTTEIEILRAVAMGKTTKEIAAERFSSIHTIITHKKNIFRKLHVNTAYEATKYAVRSGLIDPSEFYI